MTIRDDRREASIDLMADHLLVVGLRAANLKALAVAAGTSDRMLLYYFDDKDEILTVTLERVALRLIVLLEAAMPSGEPLEFPDLLQAVWGVVGSPSIRPFMLVWLDLAAGAARGEQPHREIAGRIADGFLAWVSARVDAPECERARLAARALATTDGLMLLDALGRRDIADMAAGAP